MPYSTLPSIYSTLQKSCSPLLRIITVYSSWLRSTQFCSHSAPRRLLPDAPCSDSTWLYSTYTLRLILSLSVFGVHIRCFLLSLKLSFKTRVLVRLTSSYSWALTLGLSPWARLLGLNPWASIPFLASGSYFWTSFSGLVHQWRGPRIMKMTPFTSRLW